jgi:hypothetical protein
MNQYFMIGNESLSRRNLLARASMGFGGVALAAMLQEQQRAAAAIDFAAKARHIIFCYMDGGPSQVDLFDPKPLLEKEHGQPIKMKVQPTQFNNVGTVLKSPWKFQLHGESGLPFSELIPYIGAHADDLCVVRSMTSEFPEHTNANYFLHTGHGLQGRPSMGSWFSYGLGTECRNLPGFIVLNGGLIPPGGMDCFHNGFLPATHQGSVFKAGAHPLSDITRQEPTESAQLRKLELLRKLDQSLIGRLGPQDAVESAIANYELAFRMQSAVPQLADVTTESKATQDLYGLNSDFQPTKIYGRNCLIARRMVEAGVRFIELTCPGCGHDRWDQHSNLKIGHEDNCRSVDQPIGGLLTDLKARGLLDETLVVFAGEFGRTPMAQGTEGRDHNPFGFSIWMAGGGIKGGTTYGATDEYGYHAIEQKCDIHDLHATMLHLAGVDHTQLTVRFGGRDMRLTDVFGHVLTDIVA